MISSFIEKDKSLEIVKSSILILLLTLMLNSVFGLTHNVEVGGNPFLPENLPYYEPQTLNINLNDVVVWTWVSGQHSVTAISGPELFDSGEHNDPFVFEYTFTISGFYEYECSIGNHAQWQFGDVSVSNAVGLHEVAIAKGVSLFPNPANEYTRLSFGEVNEPWQLLIIDSYGKTLLSRVVREPEMRIDISSLAMGCYVIVAISEEKFYRTSFVVSH